MPETQQSGTKAINLRTLSRNLALEVALPSSKSESNRALIVSAFSEGLVEVKNLSSAADTQTLISLLEQVETGASPASGPLTLDVGPAGTVMRFMAAYLCLKPGEYLLTGSARMLERPVKILVDALRSLGAAIRYEGNEGFPPLHISKANLKGGTIQIPGDISSQYLSALLMIAARLPGGLSLEIQGELTSRPYVQMTLDMLAEAGIASVWMGKRIEIAEQSFKPAVLEVESDWSGASYWFSLVALSDRADIFLKGLKSQSLQGDRAICQLMEHFAVSHRFEAGGLRLQKANPLPGKPGDQKIPLLDFRDCPDLAQTVLACAAGLGIAADFTGLETLKIKETDRIAAMQTELNKMGVQIHAEGQIYRLDVTRRHIPSRIQFATYHDHRMAMALAPLALVIPELEFDDAAVVDKSYPSFWNDLEKAGFNLD